MRARAEEQKADADAARNEFELDTRPRDSGRWNDLSGRPRGCRCRNTTASPEAQTPTPNDFERMTHLILEYFIVPGWALALRVGADD